MKDETAIKKRIAAIETDPRYISGQKSPATVDINAPLALVQLEMETTLRTLRWVLAD